MLHDAQLSFPLLQGPIQGPLPRDSAHPVIYNLSVAAEGMSTLHRELDWQSLNY